MMQSLFGTNNCVRQYTLKLSSQLFLVPHQLGSVKLATYSLESQVFSITLGALQRRQLNIFLTHLSASSQHTVALPNLPGEIFRLQQESMTTHYHLQKFYYGVECLDNFGEINPPFLNLRISHYHCCFHTQLHQQNQNSTERSKLLTILH